MTSPRRLAVAGVCALAAAAASGCTGDSYTQVIISVNTDLAIPAELANSQHNGRSLSAWLTKPIPSSLELRTSWLLPGGTRAEQVQDSLSTTTVSASRVRVVADSARQHAYVIYEWAGGVMSALKGICLDVMP